MALGIDELRGKPPKIQREPVTGRVTKVDTAGVWVVPVGGDLRTPVGPCRGPSDIPVGTVVMIIWTQERPWVFGAELVTILNADVRDIALLEAAASAAQDLAEQVAGQVLADHAADTTDVHGIADTSVLETQQGAQDKADAAAAAGTEDAAAVAVALVEHVDDDTNPHAVTKAQIGLGNVDDTSDAEKPVSTATAEALDDKLDASAYQDTGRRVVAAAGAVTDLPTLEVVTRRRGDVVTLFTRETTAAAHAGTTPLLTLPAGFRPDAPVVTTQVTDAAGAPTAGAWLVTRSTGAVDLSAVSGARHYAAITYTTSDTWPAALPGTEDTT